MTGIYLVALIFPQGFDVVPSLNGREPVPRVIIGNFDATLSKRLCVDPLYVALIPQLSKIVLQRSIAEIGALVREVSVKGESRERQTTVYQEGENTLFALLFSHIPSVASVPNRFTESITHLIYWQIFLDLDHTFPVQGKLFVSTVHRDEATKATRGPVARCRVHPQKLKRTPLRQQRVRAGLREYGTKAMFEDTTRGQESPDRPTNCTQDSETVLVPTVDRSVIHYHRERVAGIPKCGPIGANYERRPREAAAEFAEPCGSCFRDATEGAR